MLSLSSMRRVLMAGLMLGACAEPDPNYGDPHGIWDKVLPKEESASSAPAGADFGGPYSESANKPTTTLKAAHEAKSGPAPAAVKDCFDCHKPGGQAATKPFAFGGRVSQANVDVVVNAGSDRQGPVKSDADGFFWFAGTPKAGKALIRNASKESRMVSAIQAGTGCDSAACHASSNPGKIGSGL
jgi:hypothetical protein